MAFGKGCSGFAPRFMNLIVEAELPFAHLLGHVHRLIGVLQQFLECVRIIRISRDTQTAAHMCNLAIEGEVKPINRL